ncbi:MAG: glycosyltransferase [Gemmatimonadaceae bacterium]|nr:glycosyltransferase [Gemmatimonadaceae bacterium]
MRVLIDAVNVTAAGPLGVASSLIPELLMRRALRCHGLVAEGVLSALDWRERIRVVGARRAGWSNRAQRLLDVGWRLAATARQFDVDAILTLGDIGAIRGTTPSVLFVHNALLLRDEEGVSARVQREVFARAVARATSVIVQTPIMRAALSREHDVDAARIHVVSHPSPAATSLGRIPPALDDASGSDRFRLLYLAAYYPHKRHDLLPGIARALRDVGRSKDVVIYITLPECPQTAALLSTVMAETGDLVVNLGRLSQEDAGAALSAVDGLLHLSDAESYGMTLYEALKAGRRIIAPDVPYATWACGGAATFFSAGNAEAAATAIVELLDGRGDASRLTRERETALRKFLPTWADVAKAFEDTMRSAIPR